MKRYKILHQTNYAFTGSVQLQAHTLRLRPRDSHEQRIESSRLDVSPAATIRWRLDVEDNSVAIATFNTRAESLHIESETIIQQYDHAPYDFVVDDYAVRFPFKYRDEYQILLAPYLSATAGYENTELANWLKGIWQPGENIQTYELLRRLNQHTFQSLSYQVREEEGVQTPEQTLSKRTGSCRDSAALFMAAARYFGLAARFVSGYVYSQASSHLPGATHAWAEVFIPGAGWKGFDPSTGNIVGADHIPVAVARLPESVPPVEGSFHGMPGTTLTVNVWVTELI